MRQIFDKDRILSAAAGSTLSGRLARPRRASLLAARDYTRRHEHRVASDRDQHRSDCGQCAAKNWIISPVWDLVFLIAAPLAIVPLVSLSAAHWLDVEEISLVVISFATLGHHLPGFLRAYGDRELFSRFRRRFVWAPPIVLAVALLSAAYGLHALALILLFWATWHGLMQTYGFMRIYDLKQGPGDRQSARLDFACAW